MKMKKSYIAGVAKLLGVEEGEVFHVNGDTLEKCFFKFTDGFLYISDTGKDDSWCVANDSILIRLLYGYLSIRKPLWKPTLGEKYYTPTIDCTDLSFLYKEIEDKLKNVLGSKTSIKSKSNGKGKIEIEYYSQDELERITQMLYSIKE